MITRCPLSMRESHFAIEPADRLSEPAGVALDAIPLEPWNQSLPREHGECFGYQGSAADNANDLANRPRNSDPFMKNPG